MSLTWIGLIKDGWLQQGVLHGATVQATILCKQDATVYTYDLTVGKNGLQGHLGPQVIFLVLIERQQDSSVHNKEIGIVWWYWYQAVRLTLHGTEGLQFRQHALATLAIDDGIIRAKTCKGVYVRIRVIAFQASMVQPQNAFGSKTLTQFLRQSFLRIRMVSAPIGVLVALRRSEYGPHPIAFDGTALQFKVKLGDIHVPGTVSGKMHVVEFAIDGIVQ